MIVSKPGRMSRRTLLMAATAVPLCGIPTRPASAAEFVYKFATGQDPTHPVNIRAQEAIDRSAKRRARAGDQAVSGQSARLRHRTPDQVRSGVSSSTNRPRSLPPWCRARACTVFAFADYDSVWKAMDGKLGT